MLFKILSFCVFLILWPYLAVFLEAHGFPAFALAHDLVQFFRTCWSILVGAWNNIVSVLPRG